MTTDIVEPKTHTAVLFPVTPGSRGSLSLCMICNATPAQWLIVCGEDPELYVCNAHLGASLPDGQVAASLSRTGTSDTIETKEHAVLPWPPNQAQDGLPAPLPPLAQARAALAAEWAAADNPSTPAAIHRFYQQAQRLGKDLDAWHALPERQEWTRMLVHVAQQAGVTRIIDIGAGGGHDMQALRGALPDAYLVGVELNDTLRAALPADVTYASACDYDLCVQEVARADLMVCIDVLEHVVNPDYVLGNLAATAPVGCLLFETTATHDTGTPLHLPANQGWHPGRVLERHGWDLADHTGRVRVWRRVSETGRQRASLLLCAYRSVSAETMQSILALCAGGGAALGWRQRTKTGDALIARSRSIILTSWWRETADDVCLMLDDDIVFSPQDADRLVELCRGGYDIICGAYPVRNGAHFACRFLPGTEDVRFGPEQPPLEILYAATGFVAIHRRVLDALIPTLPLCHPSEPWSFYPLFQPEVVTDNLTDMAEWLSEDYGFSAAARRAGFRTWLDPQTKLTHLGSAAVSVANMAAMHQAVSQA